MNEWMYTTTTTKITRKFYNHKSHMIIFVIISVSLYYIPCYLLIINTYKRVNTAPHDRSKLIKQILNKKLEIFEQRKLSSQRVSFKWMWISMSLNDSANVKDFETNKKSLINLVSDLMINTYVTYPHTF